MSPPTAYFGDHPEAFPSSKRVRGISWEFFVGEIGVVLDRAHGFNDVYASGPVANGQLRSPDGDIQVRGRVNEFRFARAVIRIVAGGNDVSDAQAGFGPVEIALDEIRVLECHHAHPMV